MSEFVTGVSVSWSDGVTYCGTIMYRVNATQFKVQPVSQGIDPQKPWEQSTYEVPPDPITIEEIELEREEFQ